MISQEAEKHHCGRVYKKIKPMVDDPKKEIDSFGWLNYCSKCEVYNFDGRDFEGENEADKYFEENKDLIRRGSEFRARPNVSYDNRHFLDSVGSGFERILEGFKRF